MMSRLTSALFVLVLFASNSCQKSVRDLDNDFSDAQDAASGINAANFVMATCGTQVMSLFSGGSDSTWTNAGNCIESVTRTTIEGVVTLDMTLSQSGSCGYEGSIKLERLSSGGKVRLNASFTKSGWSRVINGEIIAAADYVFTEDLSLSSDSVTQKAYLNISGYWNIVNSDAPATEWDFSVDISGEARARNGSISDLAQITPTLFSSSCNVSEEGVYQMVSDLKENKTFKFSEDCEQEITVNRLNESETLVY